MYSIYFLVSAAFRNTDSLTRYGFALFLFSLAAFLHRYPQETLNQWQPASTENTVAQRRIWVCAWEMGSEHGAESKSSAHATSHWPQRALRRIRIWDVYNLRVEFFKPLNYFSSIFKLAQVFWVSNSCLLVFILANSAQKQCLEGKYIQIWFLR